VSTSGPRYSKNKRKKRQRKRSSRRSRYTRTPAVEEREVWRLWKGPDRQARPFCIRTAASKEEYNDRYGNMGRDSPAVIQQQVRTMGAVPDSGDVHSAATARESAEGMSRSRRW
jgi:hypothetical protein